MDKIYCRTCKRLFDDRMETHRRENVISWGQFMYNQQRIMWDEPIKFTGNNRHFEVSCPFCNSIKTKNGTEIMEQRNHGGDRRTQKFKLYNEVKKAFEREGLSTMNNINRYGDS